MPNLSYMMGDYACGVEWKTSIYTSSSLTTKLLANIECLLIARNLAESIQTSWTATLMKNSLTTLQETSLRGKDFLKQTIHS